MKASKDPRRFFPWLLIAAVIFSTASAGAQTAWKAGAAKVVITPEAPMWMSGYGSRTRPADGKLQDLFAKALALQDGAGKRVVFVTLDLLILPPELREDVAKQLQAARQLPSESLLLNVSHTHCGPELRYNGRLDAPDAVQRQQQVEKYLASLSARIVQVAGEALDHLEDAMLTWHHARCGFAMNRRLPRSGRFINSPNPDGPVDHDVPVLKVAGAGGKPRAILFGYACHNTTFATYQWCGDYAGFAQEYLEAQHPGAVALFMTGCGGDQNPYPRGRLEHAQLHGHTLAGAVEAALGAIAVPVEGPLALAKQDAMVDFAPQPPRGEFEKRAESKDVSLAAHARRMLARMDKNGGLPKAYPFPIQTIRFGNSLLMVALGGETVVDYSLRLKREITGIPLWVASYSNEVMGYIPSARVLREGGYEGGEAMKFYDIPFPWGEAIEEQIISKAHELSDQPAR